MSKENNGDVLHPENRKKLIGFKVTQSEEDAINAHCEKIGVSKSRFIRYLVLNTIEEEK